ncbi:MAG: 1,2-phenylacetyl-CoA epoxidase subunit PaaD [Candidatus Dormibacteria bacterium]
MNPASALTERLVGACTALKALRDPEIPTASIVELGMVHEIREDGDILIVEIIPTFTGCPALSVIVENVEAALTVANLGPVRVVTRADLPWNTAMITQLGHRQIAEFGIVPPQPGRIRAEEIRCPVCGHGSVVLVSRFGPTPCRAIARCVACGEPLEVFKPVGPLSVI